MTKRRIVVGVEGSGYARAALIWAFEEAALRDSIGDKKAGITINIWR